ncbi:hypothetical protein L345_14041, partial [Ophiophagus hannah]
MMVCVAIPPPQPLAQPSWGPAGVLGQTQQPPAWQVPPGWAYNLRQGWVQAQWVPTAVLVPPPPPAHPATLPYFKAALDGSLDKLAFYLNWVWANIDHYRENYPNDEEIIIAITENLKNWVTQLHDEGTPKLGDVDELLQEMRKRFEDTAQGLDAEAEIKAIRQKGCLAKEYIGEFQRLTGRLSYWPKCLLVHYFKEVPDWELHNAWVCQGVPHCINDW